MTTARWILEPFTTQRAAYQASALLVNLQMLRTRINLEQEFANDGLPIDAARHFADGDRQYYYSCMRSGNETFVLVSGVQNELGARGLWECYRETNDRTFGNATGNRYLDEVAYNVIRIAVTPVYNGGGLTLIGHSMGGAIWPYFASRIASALNFNNTLRMISFGAPKPSDWDLQYVTRGTYCHRFFNNDDPVPLVPYDPGVFSSYFIFHGLNEMRRLGRFCQRTNGYEIAPTGFFSRANLPSAASANPGASVSAWLAAQTANQETAHSIVSYYSRLQRVANSPPVQPPVPAPTLLAQPVAITPLEERRANELAVATIVNDSYRRNQTPVRIPDNRLFRVYRSGRLYTVTFGDVEVANSMNKKRARGLARVGNDWLRRLQRQEIVATDNLAGMFAEYLAAAADPTSGIVPVLNTGEEI